MTTGWRRAAVALLSVIAVAQASVGVADADNDNTNTNTNDVTDLGSQQNDPTQSEQTSAGWPPTGVTWPPQQIASPSQQKASSGGSGSTPIVMPSGQPAPTSTPMAGTPETPALPPPILP